MNPILSIGKIQFNSGLEVHLDQKEAWILELIDELNDSLSDEDDMLNETPSLTLKGQFEKHKQGGIGDIILLRGEVHARFYAQCVKSGDLMLDDLICPVQAIFVDEAYKYKIGEDEIVYFFKDEEFDLFYYENKKINLKEMLHEFLFLNKNPYPKLG